MMSFSSSDLTTVQAAADGQVGSNMKKNSSPNKQRDGSAAAAAKEVPRRKCGEINTRRNATATTRSPSVAVVAIIPAQEGLLLPSSQRHVSSKNHRIAPASPRMKMID